MSCAPGFIDYMDITRGIVLECSTYTDYVGTLTVCILLKYIDNQFSFNCDRNIVKSIGK